MRSPLLRSAVGLSACLVVTGSSLARESGAPRAWETRSEPTFGFYFDNDAFGGSDRDYSNGLRFAWLSGDRSAEELGFLRPFTGLLGGDGGGGILSTLSGFDDPSKVRYNYGLSLTQLIYTPDDKFSYAQPLNERRYAGWLGLGVSLNARDEDTLNSLEFVLGTTGPHSLGETTQDLIHELLGGDKFNGWRNQIPNEITADLSFVQKRRADLLNAGPWGVDGLIEWGARLGTFRTDAHAGAQLRAGFNLPNDFSDARLAINGYAYNDGAVPGNWSVYVLGGVTGRGVLHDATLDGPLFRDFSTGNDREPFVGEGYLGLGVRYHSVELSYVHTWQSREYQEQRHLGEFGTLAVRMSF